MINNKGQVLTLFILIIPLVILIFILIIDIGLISNEKQKLDNINYMTIEYGVNHINDPEIQDKLTNIINLNIDQINEINIEINNEKIEIKLTKKTNSIISNKLKIFKLTSHYSGYLKEDKIIIERV